MAHRRFAPMSTHETAHMRERILSEATRLFVQRGYHAISMREIAEAVGVSKAGLYYHFTDKQELLLAILENYLTRIEALIDEARTRETDARHQIEAFLQGIFAEPPEHRAIIRLANQELSGLAPEARARFGQRYTTQFIGKLEALLRSGMDRGELQPANTAILTWMIMGMAYPFLSPGHELPPTAQAEAIRLIVRTLFDGLAPRG